jgi:glycosyltransferase involved in cell wall biosynthesis
VFLAEQVEHNLSDAVIADCYHLADALFLPSREEGFGIPILEAGLAGLPIFCADIPPLRSLGGSFATYFSPDADPVHVAAQVQRRLAAEPTFGLRQEVKQAYTWQSIYAQKIKPLIIGSS